VAGGGTVVAVGVWEGVESGTCAVEAVGDSDGTGANIPQAINKGTTIQETLFITNLFLIDRLQATRLVTALRNNPRLESVS
jgi:hypothetical protein